MINSTTNENELQEKLRYIDLDLRNTPEFLMQYKEIEYIKWELYNFVVEPCQILSIQDFEWEENICV